jgi:hypothetical protein
VTPVAINNARDLPACGESTRSRGAVDADDVQSGMAFWTTYGVRRTRPCPLMRCSWTCRCRSWTDTKPRMRFVAWGTATQSLRSQHVPCRPIEINVGRRLRHEARATRPIDRGRSILGFIAGPASLIPLNMLPVNAPPASRVTRASHRQWPPVATPLCHPATGRPSVVRRPARPRTRIAFR